MNFQSLKPNICSQQYHFTCDSMNCPTHLPSTCCSRNHNQHSSFTVFKGLDPLLHLRHSNKAGFGLLTTQISRHISCLIWTADISHQLLQWPCTASLMHKTWTTFHAYLIQFTFCVLWRLCNASQMLGAKLLSNNMRRHFVAVEEQLTQNFIYLDTWHTLGLYGKIAKK